MLPVLTRTDQLLQGQLPNVYYEAVSIEQLRLLQNFKGLPPVDWIAFSSGTPSYRSVSSTSPGAARGGLAAGRVGPTHQEAEGA